MSPSSAPIPPPLRAPTTTQQNVVKPPAAPPSTSYTYSVFTPAPSEISVNRRWLRRIHDWNEKVPPSPSVPDGGEEEASLGEGPDGANKGGRRGREGDRCSRETVAETNFDSRSTVIPDDSISIRPTLRMKHPVLTTTYDKEEKEQEKKRGIEKEKEMEMIRLEMQSQLHVTNRARREVRQEFEVETRQKQKRLPISGSKPGAKSEARSMTTRLSVLDPLNIHRNHPPFTAYPNRQTPSREPPQDTQRDLTAAPLTQIRETEYSESTPKSSFPPSSTHLNMVVTSPSHSHTHMYSQPYPQSRTRTHPHPCTPTALTTWETDLDSSSRSTVTPGITTRQSPGGPSAAELIAKNYRRSHASEDAPPSSYPSPWYTSMGGTETTVKLNATARTVEAKRPPAPPSKDTVYMEKKVNMIPTQDAWNGRGKGKDRVETPYSIDSWESSFEIDHSKERGTFGNVSPPRVSPCLSKLSLY